MDLSVSVFFFFWSTFSFLLNHRTDTNVCHQSLDRNGILYETYLLGHGGGRYCFVEYVSLIEDIDSSVCTVGSGLSVQMTVYLL